MTENAAKKKGRSIATDPTTRWQCAFQSSQKLGKKNKERKKRNETKANPVFDPASSCPQEMRL